MKRQTTSPHHSPLTTHHSPSQRSGAFLIVAMICLVLTTGLLGMLLKMAVLSRKAARMEAAALQAEWLAESALDRAAAKLKGDAGYQGETWNITKEDLGGPYAGAVKIAVKPSEATPEREVEVIARFPLEGSNTVKRTKRLAIAVSVPLTESDTPETSPAFAEKREEGEKGR